MKINVNGKVYWYDWDLYQKQQEFQQQKEKEYWDYHFSGQRTIDLFGEEGVKRVLARQDRNDKRLQYDHKSRGR